MQSWKYSNFREIPCKKQFAARGMKQDKKTTYGHVYRPQCLAKNQKNKENYSEIKMKRNKWLTFGWIL